LSEKTFVKDLIHIGGNSGIIQNNAVYFKHPANADGCVSKELQFYYKGLAQDLLANQKLTITT